MARVRATVGPSPTGSRAFLGPAHRQDVRNQHITDATWRALQERVLGTGWRGDSLVQVCEPGAYSPLKCVPQRY